MLMVFRESVVGKAMRLCGSVDNKRGRRFLGLLERTVGRVSELSPEALLKAGVRGIILDLDNTTLGYGCDDIPPDITVWVRQARERGLVLVLLSNNFTRRARRVSEELQIPAIAGALKPLPHGFLRALALLGTARGETIVVGDQLFTDVLGAHLAGLRVILTHPLEPRDWAGTRVLRFFERLVLGER